MLPLILFHGARFPERPTHKGRSTEKSCFLYSIVWKLRGAASAQDELWCLVDHIDSQASSSSHGLFLDDLHTAALSCPIRRRCIRIAFFKISFSSMWSVFANNLTKLRNCLNCELPRFITGHLLAEQFVGPILPYYKNLLIHNYSRSQTVMHHVLEK